MRGYYIYFLMLFSFLVSCDHVAEGDQWIPVATETSEGDGVTTTTKNILLEDFTGQRCSNCPSGTEVIESLQQLYSDRLIAVGIHGGDLGFKGSNTQLGLATDTGDEYYRHWNLKYQPVGLIDRGAPTGHLDWGTSVREAMRLVSTVDMRLTATLANGQIAISVEERQLASTAYTGKLQVWVLEDGIVAIQFMPDGSRKADYVHNHVFRTAVNGIWGEDISINGGETKTQTMTQAVDPTWNTANLSVVAFVYNDNGVEQAVKAHVTTGNE